MITKLHLVELGNSVDQHRDFGAEILLELSQFVVCVLDGVMQQGSCKSDRTNAQLGKYLGYGQRVGYVRFTALAKLIAMREFGSHECALDNRGIAFWVVDFCKPKHLAQSSRVGTVPREQAWQHALETCDAAGWRWVAHVLLL